MLNYSIFELVSSIFGRVQYFYLVKSLGINIDPLLLWSVFDVLRDADGKNQEKSGLNSKLTLLNIKEKQLYSFTITVPAHECWREGKVSCYSPLGAAALKKGRRGIYC